MKKVSLSYCLWFSFAILSAQDTHYSQPTFARTLLNPAYTGTDCASVISTGYRNQWTKLYYPNQSFYFSADNYFHFLHAGLGFCYSEDYEMKGAFTRTRYDFNYAPQIVFPHDKGVIRMGFQASVIYNFLDWSKLNFGDNIDTTSGFVYHSREVPNRTGRTNADFSIGLLANFQHFFGGFSVYHITQPDVGLFSSSKLPAKVIIHTGAQINFRRDTLHHFVLSPEIIYRYQKKVQSVFFGASIKYKVLSLGLYYCHKDAAIVSLAFVNHLLRIGYSYDYTLFGLGEKITGGSHEVNITWYIPRNNRKSKVIPFRPV